MTGVPTELFKLSERYAAASDDERAQIREEMEATKGVEASELYWSLLQCITVVSGVPVEELDEEIAGTFGHCPEKKLAGLRRWIEEGDDDPAPQITREFH